MAEAAAAAAARLLDRRGVLGTTLGLPPGECEVLYGRCGWLQALLLARKYAGVGGGFGRSEAAEVIAQVLAAGEALAASQQRGRGRGSGGGSGGGPPPFPLLWAWHDKVYFGAAHGVAGIVFTLLHFLPENEAVSKRAGKDYAALLRGTADALAGRCFAGGNLPSSAGSARDRLVHWCHGAPGFAPLMCRCAQVFGAGGGGGVDYLACAVRAGEVVWARGLLHKGVGLCHGISGNAYALLSV